MYEFFYQKKSIAFRKLICSFVALTFSMGLVLGPTSIASAQYVSNLPQPGTMVLLSPAFQPPVLKGMTLHPENPLHFDFIVDRGQDRLSGDALKTETQKLLKYFLAAMTIPDDDSWVNLSPYEGDRIIPDMLGSTDMGKQMLEQDYLLKQLSASLTNPQEEIGKKFWDTVYKKAYEKFGTTAIPISTFNKVWIVPDRALILEEDGYVFIGETHLKVMLDEDYTSIKANLKSEKFGTKNIAQDKVEALNSVSSEVVRQVILPELEKEINEGKNFTAVRQIYNSVILAAWYKQNLKNSLLGRVYVDKSKIAGVDIGEKDLKQKVYEQYLAAFRKGVYNLIKEDYDLSTKETLPRKYFSGGLNFLYAQDAITRINLAAGNSTALAEASAQAAGYKLKPIVDGIRQAAQGGKFTSISALMTEGSEAATVTQLAAVASAPLTGDVRQSAAIGEFTRRVGDTQAKAPVLPATIIEKVLPANLAKLRARGVPADSIDYWVGHYIELLRRENPAAYELWRSENEHVLSRTFDAPIPNFKEGAAKNATFSSDFPEGMTINGVSLELPASDFMQDEYRQAATNVDYYRSDANAGYGESLKRQQNLLELIKAGLIPDRARDPNGLPMLLAKSMDTFIPITLSGGRTVMISVFELRILRVIQFAQKGTYKSVNLQQLVNEQSKDIVRLFLTNKFPDFAYELLGLTQERVAELQSKRIENYQQLFQELGVTILDVDEYQGLPTVNPDTLEVDLGQTANAGHGLVAYRKLHELLNQGKKLLADQRAGRAIPDLNNVIYEYDNGDGPNNGAPTELVGYVAQRGIGMALLGVTRAMIDIKVGASYRLMGTDAQGNPTELLDGAEIAGFKNDPEALSLFLAAGRTPETAGKQWANTNTLLISGKMALFLAELAEIVGEDVLFKAMMPSLILSKKNGVFRLEGAMITTVFNTFNFVNTSKDPKVLALMAKHGFDAEHPLLALPSLPSGMRDDYFTPIKFIGDMMGMETAFSRTEKFGAIDSDLNVKFSYSPGLINFDSDGSFAARTGISSYNDLAEARELVGSEGDWSEAKTFTILGRVKLKDPTIIGNVHLEYYGDGIFDVDKWIETKTAIAALSNLMPDGVRLTSSGQARLQDVMIIVSKDGRVSFSPYNAKWLELSLEARQLLSFLHMMYKDQPMDINLQSNVVDTLLIEAGVDIQNIAESDRGKKVISLLSELGIKAHDKGIIVDGQKTTTVAYSFKIAVGGEVVSATAQQLQDRIMSASSSLLGESGTAVASSGVGQATVHLVDINAVTAFQLKKKFESAGYAVNVTSGQKMFGDVAAGLNNGTIKADVLVVGNPQENLVHPWFEELLNARKVRLAVLSGERIDDQLINPFKIESSDLIIQSLRSDQQPRDLDNLVTSIKSAVPANEQKLVLNQPTTLRIGDVTQLDNVIFHINYDSRIFEITINAPVTDTKGKTVLEIGTADWDAGWISNISFKKESDESFFKREGAEDPAKDQTMQDLGFEVELNKQTNELVVTPRKNFETARVDYSVSNNATQTQAASSAIVGQALIPEEIKNYQANVKRWDFANASMVLGHELVRYGDEQLVTSYQQKYFENQVKLRHDIIDFLVKASIDLAIDNSKLKESLNEKHNVLIRGYGGQSGLTFISEGYHSRNEQAVSNYISIMAENIAIFINQDFQAKSPEEKAFFIAEFHIKLAELDNVFSAANYSFHMAWINTMLRLSGLAGIENQEWDQELSKIKKGLHRDWTKDKIAVAREQFKQEVFEAIKAANPQIFGNNVVADANTTQAAASSPVGGIDFDPSLLNLQIKRNGKGVPLPLPQQNLENINIDGLYPVIINMQPATIQNFPFLISAESKEKVPELSMR